MASYSSGYKDPTGKDIYNQCVSCGVFMKNGANPWQPIPFSFKNLSMISLGDTDDDWLIYPGFKVILYDGSNYSGINITLDNTDVNFIRYAHNGADWNWNMTGYGANRTLSIKVLFRGSEINVSDFS